MLFNRHSELEGRHAFLSPSTNAWVNYTPDKLELRYVAASAAKRGSDLHKLAHDCIRLGVKLNRSNKALATYVNDAIGFKMSSEQPLFYSNNCFGTADAISFRRGKLRIHDLKTGLIQSKFRQLEVYAAIFCLEYSVSPFDIEIELRIYQNEDVRAHIPEPEAIQFVMDVIVEHDNQIEAIRAVERL